MSQQVSTLERGSLELQVHLCWQVAFAGFDDGVGVMGDQPAQHGVGVLVLAQVPGAVQGVQTDRRTVIVLAIGAKVLAAISLPAMSHRELDTKYPPFGAHRDQSSTALMIGRSARLPLRLPRACGRSGNCLGIDR